MDGHVSHDFAQKEKRSTVGSKRRHVKKRGADQTIWKRKEENMRISPQMLSTAQQVDAGNSHTIAIISHAHTKRAFLSKRGVAVKGSKKKKEKKKRRKKKGGNQTRSWPRQQISVERTKVSDLLVGHSPPDRLPTSDVVLFFALR